MCRAGAIDFVCVSRCCQLCVCVCVGAIDFVSRCCRVCVWVGGWVGVCGEQWAWQMQKEGLSFPPCLQEFRFKTQVLDELKEDCS